MLLTQGTNYPSLTHLFSIIRGAGSEVGGTEGEGRERNTSVTGRWLTIGWHGVGVASSRSPGRQRFMADLTGVSRVKRLWLPAHLSSCLSPPWLYPVPSTSYTPSADADSNDLFLANGWGMHTGVLERGYLHPTEGGGRAVDCVVRRGNGVSTGRQSPDTIPYRSLVLVVERFLEG